MQQMRTARIATDELEAGDQILVQRGPRVNGSVHSFRVFTLATEPYLVAGGSRWQINHLRGAFELFEDEASIVIPSTHKVTEDEVEADYDTAVEIAELIEFEQGRYNDAVAQGYGDDTLVERMLAERREGKPWERAADRLPSAQLKRYRELLAKHGGIYAPHWFDTTQTPAFTEHRRIAVDGIGAVRRGVPAVGDFILVGNAGGMHQSPGSYGYTRTQVTLVEHEHQGIATHRVRTRAFGMGCWTTGESLICGAKPE